MANLTYTKIFKKTLLLFIKSLNLKNLTKLFFHSLVFRSLIYSIGLFIPNYSFIICCSIFIYFFLVKPYNNSKKQLKLYFSNVIFILFTLITLFLMWYIIIESLNIFFPLVFDMLIFKFFSQSAGLKNIDYDNLSDGIVKNSGLDKWKCETSNEKTPKSCNMLGKIYNSLFNPNNKQVCTIKPFPIVKEAYVKTSGLNIETSNSNSSLSEHLSDKVGDNKPKELTSNINNPSDDDGSLCSSSSSSYNTVVIDLKVLKGIDGENKEYLMLKDLNDLSSENLISIQNKPEYIKVGYDKAHVQDNNCTNHKYLSFDTQIFNSEVYESKMYKKYPYMQGPDSNSLRDITFSINNEAVNQINNNSLIIESENCNRLPVKERSSFASSSNNLPSENWKVHIPIPYNLDTVSVFSQSDRTIITPKCANCTNIN